MIKKIYETIKAHPSYFKKSSKFLEHKFKCSKGTITRVMQMLEEEKKAYYQELKNNRKNETN